MIEKYEFAEYINKYMNEVGYGDKRLADEVNRLVRNSKFLSRATVRNWRDGTSKTVRKWRQLAAVARVLRLSEEQTSLLLQSAGHGSVKELWRMANHEDRTLYLSSWAESMPRQPEHKPFQAIADIPNFVGREAELQQLKGMLLAGHQITLYSLEGMGGSGKTALAVHLAHQLRDEFPDGILWGQLDASDTMSILRGFAFAYGEDISGDNSVEGRSQIVRGLLADRKVLIILDDARDDEQVKPLLPPTGSCGVIVTTRRTDLATTRDAIRISVGPFNKEKHEAIDLFIKKLGADRVQAQLAELTEIADLLEHLPYAIDIAASRMANEPNWTASNMLRRLRQEKRRLDELKYGSESVRMSFAVSYNALSSPRLQEFFVSLAAFNGEDFSVEAVAYVTDLPFDVAEDSLRQLYSLSLVRSGRPRRYRLHSLLRDFAIEKLDDTRPFARMVGFFIGYAHTHQTDYDALDAETSNLFAAFEAALQHNLSTELVSGVTALYDYLETRGLYILAQRYLTSAKSLAEEIDDPNSLTVISLNLGRTEQRLGNLTKAKEVFEEGLENAAKTTKQSLTGHLANNLGAIARDQSDFSKADEYFQTALEMAQQTNDDDLACRAWGNLSTTAYLRGNWAEADRCNQKCLAYARKSGNLLLAANPLMMAGMIAEKIGDYDKSQQYYEECLSIAEQIRDNNLMSGLWVNLGVLARKRENYSQAIGFYTQGLELAQEVAQPERIAGLLIDLVEVTTEMADLDQAENYFAQANDLATSLEHPHLVASIWLAGGMLCLRQQNWEMASEYYDRAHKIAQDLNAKDLLAESLFGQAQLALPQGNDLEADRLSQQALTIFEDKGHEHATAVRQFRAKIGLAKSDSE